MSISTGSKLVFANALRALLNEKTFEQITVENILEKSGASRATFYRHFQDKYSLMNWIYKVQADKIVSENANPSQSKNILTQCIKFIKNNEDYFSKINKFQGQNSFIEFFYSYSLDVTIDRISKAIQKDKLPYELYFSVQFYCGGLTFIISDWLESGLQKSPDEIAELVYNNIPQSIKLYLE